MSKGNTSNQSTAKAFAVLEFLAEQTEAMKLLEISDKLGMNASTVSRYLTALQDCGYVDEDIESQKYSASTKICELANKVLARFQLASFFHPYLQKASDFFGETACLSIERNFSALYVDIVVSNNKTLMNVQRIGNSAPLHCTAAGKLFLSQYNERQLNEYFSARNLEKYTERTITGRNQLVRELAKIRQLGYSLDESENEDDIHCVAYPIYDSRSRIVACIGITGPASRLTYSEIDAKRYMLKDISDEVSAQLARLGCFEI